jgi:ethanolamine utilization protein EutN
MLMGKIVGTVVSTQKDEKLEGLKFHVVKHVDFDGNPTGTDNFVVTVDAVGAGIGEVVLFASGSAARQTSITKDRPVDAVIMAIVDVVEIDGKKRYVK